MKSLIGGWEGKRVALTLRLGGLTGALTLDGKLLKVGDCGVLLEQVKGEVFVPSTSILHICVKEGA